MKEEETALVKYIRTTLKVCSGIIEKDQLRELRKEQEHLLHKLSFEESWRAFDIVNQTLSMRLDF